MSTSDTLDVVKIIVAVLGAIPALWVYYKNSRLRRAEWLASLYEKFYERPNLKDVREILDCEGGKSAAVDKLVNEEAQSFTDYLNFFEFVAVLRKSHQLTDEQIEDLFGYYLDCLESCTAARTYIAKKGYEQLDQLLRERAQPR
jgi:hypothetical protein